MPRLSASTTRLAHTLRPAHARVPSTSGFHHRRLRAAIPSPWGPLNSLSVHHCIHERGLTELLGLSGHAREKKAETANHKHVLPRCHTDPTKEICMWSLLSFPFISFHQKNKAYMQRAVGPPTQQTHLEKTKGIFARSSVCVPASNKRLFVPNSSRHPSCK